MLRTQSGALSPDGRHNRRFVISRPAVQIREAAPRQECSKPRQTSSAEQPHRARADGATDSTPRRQPPHVSHGKGTCPDHVGGPQSRTRSMVDRLSPHCWAEGRDAGSVNACTERTIGDALGRYLAQVTPHKAASSQRNDEMHARTLDAFVGALELRRITTPLLIERVRDPLSHTPTRANRVRSLGSHVWTEATRWGWVDATNPWRLVPQYRERARVEHFTDAERSAIASAIRVAIDTRRISVAAGCCLGVLLESGLRPVEARTLRRGAVPGWTQSGETCSWMDWAARDVVIANGKARRLLSIPLNGESMAWAYESTRHNDHPTWVFPGWVGGQPIVDLREPFAIVLEIAGIPGHHRLYELRHSVVTSLLRAGASTSVAGRAVGHTNERTTARYAHLSSSDVRLAIARLKGGAP